MNIKGGYFMHEKSCQVLIDDIWEDCLLSDDEIQTIYVVFLLR